MEKKVLLANMLYLSSPLAACYCFADPQSAKFLSQHIDSRLAFVNQIPAHILGRLSLQRPPVSPLSERRLISCCVCSRSLLSKQRGKAEPELALRPRHAVRTSTRTDRPRQLKLAGGIAISLRRRPRYCCIEAKSHQATKTDRSSFWNEHGVL